MLKLTEKKLEILHSLGINDEKDIINYFPYRYERLEYLDFKDWQIDSKVIFSGKVSSKVKLSRFKGKQSVVYFDVETEYDIFHVSCFNRIWLLKLQLGQSITIIGKYQGNSKILALNTSNEPYQNLIGIHPVYSLKEKLTDKYFSSLVKQCLLEKQINNFLPQELIDKYQLLDAKDALENIHFPKDENLLLKAIKTIKYEEFFKYGLQINQRKSLMHVKNNSYQKNFNYQSITNFIENLPFKLTDDQLKSIDEILNDLASDVAMYRLLQGDVGSGKTIVAFIAMIACALANKQAALMVPTEILAKQHLENFKKIVNDQEIAILYSSQDKKERNYYLKKIEDNEIKLIIGTHSLFQDSVNFANLGLVITDEQHRFGVKQRQSMLLKGNYVDVLLMSATPIPRSLAAIIYGDMDISTIKQMPNKDKVIHTKLIKQNSFIPIINEIEELLKDNQMYVICPSIEDNGNTRNVNDIYNNLKKYFDKRYNVGLLHGQLDNKEKENVEKDFKEGKINILVSTTVVEVGVDVKNANIMVIYDANRFGLAQLHQLRGRVGRGQKEGYCYLLTASKDINALKKLEFIENCYDGFELSNYDLKMRGPGDAIGTRQSGLPLFILGNVIDDFDLLAQAKQDANEYFQLIDCFPIIKNYLY